MKQSVTMGIVLFAGVIACGAAWVLLPAMQAPQQRVESAAAVPLERARRLLHQYDARLPYSAEVVDQLRDAGVEPDDPDALSDDALDAYQQIHEQMWATFQPTDWADRPVPARANYSAIEQQMRSGLSDRARFVNEQDALLRDAAKAVDEALAVSSGDASGRDLAEALRLKGTIQYYSGMADSIHAAVIRLQTVPVRDDLDRLANEATDLSATASLVADSGVEEKLADAQRRLERARAAYDGQQGVVEDLDRSIADIRQRIASSKEERERAETEMNRLRETGIDFGQPDASSRFGQAYLAADRRLRNADRQVRYLTTGYYPAAEIDRSGDYLTGRYVENGSPFYLLIEPGLNHFQRERSVEAKVLADRARDVEQWQATIERLDDLRGTYEQRESAAGERLSEVRGDINDVLDELDDISANAEALEDAALNRFEQSTRTIGSAVSAAGRWVSEAQQQTQAISSENQGRSAFKPRTDDRWMAGFVLAQSADARLARAWIFYTRYAESKRNAELFKRVAAAADLSADDITAESDAATAARESGIEEIKAAMDDLKRAHRDAEGHWTLVAQAGGTEYLLALFGDRSYVADTIETYRKAVENREDSAAARPFVARLHELEAR